MADLVNAPESRSSYLLDGQRVTVADLVRARLVAPGDALRFNRPRVGDTHRAVIAGDGGIALDDGRTFRSPSRAAAEAAGMRAVDGWYAWVVDSTGRLLDSLAAAAGNRVRCDPSPRIRGIKRGMNCR